MIINNTIFDDLPEISTKDILEKYHKNIMSFISIGYSGFISTKLESRLYESNNVGIFTLFEENNIINYTGIHNSYQLRYLRFAVSVFNNNKIYLLWLNDYHHKIFEINSPKDVINFMAEHSNYSHYSK